MASLNANEQHANSKEYEFETKLLALSIENKHFEFIRTKGNKFIDDPELLSLKLGISIEQASGAIEALGSSCEKFLSNEEKKSVETFLKNQPEFQSVKKIALFCDIDEELVAKYLESKPLSDFQKDSISKLFTTGYSIDHIAYKLKLSSIRKVQECVDNKFITFCDEEGQRILQILQKQENLGTFTGSKLRKMIKTRNLKLQNEICCIFPMKSKEECERVRKYFERFDESRHFFALDINLSIEDILFIRDSSLNIEQLSIKLNKVESVIREYLVQYCPNQEESDYFAYCQKKKIEYIVLTFGKDTKTFQTYWTIVTDSCDNLIKKTERVGINPMEAFNQLLPLVFYYLKCSLPFEDITMIIAKACKITLTSYDIFHLIFQLSDPVVRGLCIEHYSFSNPVPLYYPRIRTELPTGGKIELSLCTELWYCLQEYHGLVSFGLGQASWNAIGKSYLLDLVFETDFVEGNPQNSAFHLQSIDIQLSRNLFGELNTISTETEETMKWAYIDCHRYSDPNIISVICQRLDIALVHVSHSDYLENHSRMTEEINQLAKCILHLYVFIRDCDETEAIIQRKNETKTYIFLPNLTKRDKNVYSTLKTIGHEILHLRNKNPKLIGTEFIESVMTELRSPNCKEIQTDKKIIQTIIDYIKKHTMSINEIDFSFLSYYPSFVKYMQFYYQASLEKDCKDIHDLNVRCVNLKESLEETNMGNLSLYFNDILERNYSGLLLWKLSQELSVLTNQVLLRNKGVTGKYSIEILWREALLTSKFGTKLKYQRDRENYKERFACNLSSQVERGEAFELIDGDNLRFFNKDINALLTQLYKKQSDELSIINEGKRVCMRMRQAPIVVSIFGPQSSGKSTLLNYCFGCKFLTSAGRCTRGIYGSLARLSQPINLTNQFLILDTEGLDGGNKSGPSSIHFDRTMVLFCLAVSQVVIINIKGELGEEMQNLLQICAYSLNKLRVSKVVAPKIFFVLNQQADPDPNKHVDSMNNLLRKLEEESDLMELEGTIISNLIQVSRNNLFILPSAFNFIQMNKPAAKLFDSEVIKLSPTIAFANRCAELRQSIINELIESPPDERATFNSMSEWLEMSGVIWETIIRYQDIVKYRNVEELKSYNKLTKMVSELMEKHIFHYEKELDNISEQLICEIKMMTKVKSPTTLLEENMQKFDETFKNHSEECLIEFNSKCQSDNLLKKMNHVCEEIKSNLARLIYIERKNYKDRLKYQIRAVLTEMKLTEKMKKFQEKISKNIDKYLDKSEEEQTKAFEEIWGKCFGDNERDGEEDDKEEDFDNLYTIFKMETKTMENIGTIHELLLNANFDMDKAIELLRSEMQNTFERNPTSFTTDNFIYPCMQNNIPIKEMNPFTGEDKFEYLDKDTLYTVNTSSLNPLYASAIVPLISEWVPKSCHSLVNYCSGYYNHADITWEMEERNQIMLLASLLRDPNNAKESTWGKLINKISSKVEEIIKSDPEISQGTVKQLVNSLCSTIKHVNHEINCIQARLTIAAERTLSILVFAFAFKSKCDFKTQIKNKSILSNEKEKLRKMEYFLSTIEKCKMARGNWDRKEMRLNDRRTSNFFALEFLEAVKRSVITDEQTRIVKKFKQRKDSISYKSILLQVEELVNKELESQDGEIIDQNNLVVQSICNRKEIIKREFNRNWEELVEVLYDGIFTSLKDLVTNRINKIKVVLATMLRCLEKKNSDVNNAGETGFDSDSNFSLDSKPRAHVSEEQINEIILKSGVIYLRIYLDPNITQKQFKAFFNDFKVDGIRIKKKKGNCLCDKPNEPTLNVNNETFKKLANTRMFDSVQIFNIHEYIREFKSTLDGYEFELSRPELDEIIKSLRDAYSYSVINCPNQCPSCGKFCERELHPHGGRCQIRTGHQICSMGGKVWKNDRDKTAVLLTCDNYEDDTIVQLPGGQKMNWHKFKQMTGNEWDWTSPDDIEYIALQEHNREKMEKIWDKFGRGILKYHATPGVKIKYIPFSSVKNTFKISESKEYYICFVIAITGSERNLSYSCRLMDSYQKYGKSASYKIVVYDNHCTSKKVIEQFPADGSFTENQVSIIRYLSTIEVQCETDDPRAVLDGLATAATGSAWRFSQGVRNIICHIYDAPPHGNFPKYKSHSSNSKRRNCCCCNHGTLCHFDWDRDVWERMHRFNIEYNGISDRGKFTLFEDEMQNNLGELCTNYHWAEKEDTESNPTPLSIFIDYKTD